MTKSNTKTTTNVKTTNVDTTNDNVAYDVAKITKLVANELKMTINDKRVRAYLRAHATETQYDMFRKKTFTKSSDLFNHAYTVIKTYAQSKKPISA